MAQPHLRTLRVRRPRSVVCPACHTRQPFRQHSVAWKRVKDLHADHPMLVRVPRVYARCRAAVCARRIWRLPTPGVARYARATDRLKQEAIAGLIDDNTTTRRVARRLARSLNTTASKSTVDRWKHQAAARIPFARLIPLLGFSGLLGLDEYKPRRAAHYDVLACDAQTGRLLYLEECPERARGAASLPRGTVEHVCGHLRALGLQPRAVLVDMAVAYPKVLKRVWPMARLQFDYFHVIQEAYRHLNAALLALRRALRTQGRDDDAWELWDARPRMLRRPDRLTPAAFEHQLRLVAVIPELAPLLDAKERLHAIFAAGTAAEATIRRHAFLHQGYSDPALQRLQQFLASWRWPYMITYLTHPGVPRCSRAEACIRQWRLMEKVRYGLSARGRQDHLKLFQMRRYLGWKIA